MSRLDKLPREIISLICALLKQPAKYSCIFVNRELYDAAIPELWREPTLVTTAPLKKLIRCLKISKHQRGEYIRTLKLGYKVSLNDDELLALLQLTPNLEVLELRKADQITDKSIVHVSRYCNLLKSFGVTNALITYRSVHYLGQCLQLKRLTLAACSNLSPLALLPFVSHKIEYLDLSGCKWLNVLDTAYDLASFQHITHLNLVCCDTINMEFIHYITQQDCLVNLQDFSLTGGLIIEDSAIIPFVKSHPNIRGLFLLECAITDQSLDAIATYLPLLHNLDLSFCRRLTTNGVRRLINCCQNLRLLGLKDCGITQTSFSEIPNTITENYPYLSTLSYIDLGYIRAQHAIQEASPNEETSDTEMVEDTPNVMENEDDSIIESYGFIQQYLSTSISL
ncbi:hypothetical protein EDC96DRAFT_517140 [Choanephora cucurbitarum]|nr:hypothetical protein EDC96DRAFT_517140 [Choanephora cucurbitarum]